MLGRCLLVVALHDKDAKTRTGCFGGSLSCCLAKDFQGSTSTRSEMATSTTKSSTPAFPGCSGVHAGQTGFHPGRCSSTSNARARVVKLDTALVAVGEMDPLYPSVRDALKQAQSKAWTRSTVKICCPGKSHVEELPKIFSVEGRGSVLICLERKNDLEARLWATNKQN